jgi:hypothetical protein
MNSKKAITLLVLLTLILGMIPFTPVSALSVPDVYYSDGDSLEDNDGNGVDDIYKGEKIVVEGSTGDVPSGEVVTIYWDNSLIAWDGTKGKLNQTTAGSSGSYEVWFKVPESTYGNHYVWIRSGTQDPISVKLQVRVKVSLSATSGLIEDKTDVTANGLSKDTDCAVFFVNSDDIDDWNYDSDTDTYDPDDKITGTLEFKPIVPGYVYFYEDWYDPMVPDVYDMDGDGKLYYDPDEDEIGTINYVTGAFTIDYGKIDGDPVPVHDVLVDYDYFDEQSDDTYVLTTAGDSNSLGTYVKRVEIPNANKGSYFISVMDSKGHYGTKAFKLGSVITLSKEEGPTGTMVRVEGRGFTSGRNIPEAAGDKGTTAGISLTIGDTPLTYWTAKIHEYDPAEQPEVGTDGEIRLDIYIPDPDDTSEDYYIVLNDGVTYATADFEVTKEPTITVTPNHGNQGSRVTVTGSNFIQLKDEKVYFYLFDQDGNEYERLVNSDDYDSDISDANVKVNSDGSFTKEIRIPAALDGTFDLVAIYWLDAVDGEVNMDAQKTFRVGSILVLLSEDEGVVGREIYLEGNGFSPDDDWNATFGDLTLFDDDSADDKGLISGTFYVPMVAPGTYTIIVTDVKTEITVTTDFTVTQGIMFTVDPSTAPTGYNLTFTAQNWPEGVDDWDFLLYNMTEGGVIDEDWDIKSYVKSGDDPERPFDPIMEDEDTEELIAEGWWVMKQPNGDPFSKGTYMLNITNTEDFYVTLTLVVGDEHVSIAPRKATFRIGDTVSFNIQHSFGNVAEADDGKVKGGKINIYDPSGTRYWATDKLETWTKSGMFYYVPIANQLSASNPMILLDDAPLGTWTYKWYENDAIADKGGEGEVIASGTFAVSASDADVLNQQIEDLNQAVTDLTTDISTVSSEMAGVRTQITNAINAANAAVQAANAATQAVNAVAQTASAASTAAQNAATAATEAKNAANGLTTLVYGAIGASLVAALAAIVSLMQISRRIAG